MNPWPDSLPCTHRRTMRTRALILSAAALFITGTGLAFAQSSESTNRTYLPNFVNIEIATLAEAVATATGKQMLLHPRVQGVVTLISDQPLSASQLYAAFAQTVVVKGYVMDEEHGVVKIYPGKLKE